MSSMGFKKMGCEMMEFSDDDQRNVGNALEGAYSILSVQSKGHLGAQVIFWLLQESAEIKAKSGPRKKWARRITTACGPKSCNAWPAFVGNGSDVPSGPTNAQIDTAYSIERIFRASMKGRKLDRDWEILQRWAGELVAIGLGLKRAPTAKKLGIGRGR
jgi:hypothetical protein